MDGEDLEVNSSVCKILTVVFDLGLGGTQRAACNFAVGFHELGFASKVLVTRSRGVRVSELSQAKIDVWEFNEKYHRRQLEAWIPEIVHLHSHRLDATAIYWLKEKFPNSCFIETNVFSHPSPWDDVLDISLQLTNWCDFLYRHRREPAKVKTSVVGNPVVTKNFARSSVADQKKVRRQLGIPQHAIVLGRLGQALEGKWSLHLMKAFNSLAERHESIWLLLVNPPPTLLEARTESNFANRIVVVTDNITLDSEICDFYSIMDVFCHIADQGESFGLVLVEAMLCEVPVVTLETPWGDNSQAEVVRSGETGLVARNLQQWEKFVETLIVREHYRLLLGSKARAVAVASYDLIKTCEKVISVCSKIVSVEQIETGRSARIGKPVSVRRDCELMKDRSFLETKIIRSPYVRPLMRYILRFETWLSCLKRICNKII